MPTIGRINFCKNKTSVVPVTTAAPLVTEAVDIASFGCRPLISHERAANAAVLSEVNETGQAYVRAVVQSTATAVGPTDVDQSGTGASNYDPPDSFASYAAGLSGVQPITGTAASPFPAANEPVVNLNVRFGNKRIVRSASGVPVFGDPIQPGDIMSISGAGFGSFGDSTSDFRFEGNVLLNGIRRKASKRWRAFHRYNPLIRMPFTPTYSPLLPTFLAFTNTYSFGFANTFAATFNGFVQPIPTIQCAGQVAMVLVRPALQSCVGVNFLGDPSISTINNNGPSLDRRFCEFDAGEFVVGGYNSNDIVNLVVADTLRPHLIVYADQTVSSVSASPGGGSNITVGPILIEPTNPADIFRDQIIDKAFLMTLDGTEDTFTFSMSGPCGSMTTDTVNFFTASGLTHLPGVHYWWEGYAHISTTPINP